MANYGPLPKDSFAKIPIRVGFSDGALESLSSGPRTGDLRVTIRAWDESEIVITFQEVALVLYQCITEGALHEFVECRNSELLSDARQAMKEGTWGDGPIEKLRHLSLVDECYVPILQVFCEGFDVAYNK